MSGSLDGRLSPVLDVLTFPAERWQIVTAAEEYGADLRTRTALRALTSRTYMTREMLLREIARIDQPTLDPGGGRPGIPGVPRARPGRAGAR